MDLSYSFEKSYIRSSSVTTTVTKENGFFIGAFQAMASPCVLLIETDNEAMAVKLTDMAYVEAKRIEQKFSRYIQGNICDRLNHSNGLSIPIDTETHLLLDFSNQCYQISEGLFDMTSGILRHAWTFDGSERTPNSQDIEPLLAKIGWHHIRYDQSTFVMPAGMELDFGGIGKEYAVDKVVQLMRDLAEDISVLVNFGGDMAVSCSPKTNQPWKVGIEDPSNPQQAIYAVEVREGAIATSGDSRRYILKDNTRYSHILNPKTGWPITGAPQSITVASQYCLEAGFLATLAQLHGSQALPFLDSQEVKYWHS
jgi:FAD:protein FMN transferase